MKRIFAFSLSLSLSLTHIHLILLNHKSIQRPEKIHKTNLRRSREREKELSFSLSFSYSRHQHRNNCSLLQFSFSCFLKIHFFTLLRRLLVFFHKLTKFCFTPSLSPSWLFFRHVHELFKSRELKRERARENSKNNQNDNE